MSTPTQRPTPMTDQMEVSLAKSSNVRRYYAALAQMRVMEVERDEAREQIEAMREAIRVACEALADLAERWEETPEWHNMAEHNSAWCGKIFTNVRQCKKSHAALTKLQPFLKP